MSVESPRLRKVAAVGVAAAIGLAACGKGDMLNPEVTTITKLGNEALDLCPNGKYVQINKATLVPFTPEEGEIPGKAFYIATDPGVGLPNFEVRMDLSKNPDGTYELPQDLTKGSVLIRGQIEYSSIPFPDPNPTDGISPPVRPATCAIVASSLATNPN